MKITAEADFKTREEMLAFTKGLEEFLTKCGGELDLELKLTAGGSGVTVPLKKK